MGIFLLPEEFRHQIIKEWIAKDHLAEEMKKAPDPGHLVISGKAFELEAADDARGSVRRIGERENQIAANP